MIRSLIRRIVREELAAARASAATIFVASVAHDEAEVGDMPPAASGGGVHSKPDPISLHVLGN